MKTTYSREEVIGILEHANEICWAANGYGILPFRDMSEGELLWMIEKKIEMAHRRFLQKIETGEILDDI